MTTFPAEDLYPGEDLFASGIGGGVYSRGQSGTLYIGEDAVVAAYWGDLLIWDGTISAFVSATTATMAAYAWAPVVRSQPAAIAAPTATATASATAPSFLTVTVSVTAPPAQASASAPAPVVSADANIAVPVATSAASALPPLSDSQVVVPVATATATAHVPDVATTGSMTIGVPVASATAAAHNPAVVVSRTLSVPVATASGTGTAPVVARSFTVAPPKATATASATAPVVTAVTFAPSGMTKNGTFGLTSSTWTTITNWTANTGTYPGSTVSGNGIVAQGSKTGASLTANIAYTGSFGQQTTVRLLVNGVVVATGSGNPSSSGNATCSTTRNIANGDIVTVQGHGGSGGFTPATVSSGTNTYVRIT